MTPTSKPKILSDLEALLADYKTDEDEETLMVTATLYAVLAGYHAGDLPLIFRVVQLYVTTLKTDAEAEIAELKKLL